jgi:hypothetical protein
MLQTCAGSCKTGKLQQLVTQRNFLEPFLSSYHQDNQLTIKRESASLCLIIFGLFRFQFDFWDLF